MEFSFITDWCAYTDQRAAMNTFLKLGLYFLAKNAEILALFLFSPQIILWLEDNIPIAIAWRWIFYPFLFVYVVFSYWRLLGLLIKAHKKNENT